MTEEEPDWKKVAREILKKAFKDGKLEKFADLMDERLSLSAMNMFNHILTTNEKFADSLNFGIYRALNPGRLFNRIEVEGFDANHKLVVYYELGKPSSLRGLASKDESSARRRISLKAFGRTFVELIAAVLAYLHDRYIVKKYW